jgi:putative MATE family efflux protein
MTVGKPLTQILRFCVPLLLGNLFQQLYNTVDSIVLGRFVSSGALAAVGASNPIINLMLAFVTGMAAGASILISQARGARDYERMNRIVHTILSLTLAVSAIIALAGALLTPWILRAMNTPDDIFDMARSYMTITFAGIIFLMTYNLLNAIFNGTGDSRSPFIILVITNILHVILDLVFVLGLGWGVASVAVATFISQVCSVFIGLWLLNRGDRGFKVRLRELRMKKDIIADVLRLGIPSGTQTSLQQVGNLIVARVMNAFGPVIIAANIAVIRVDSICTMPIITFGTAITVFVGQNMGAGRHDRIKEGLKATLLLSVGLSLALSVILFFWGDYTLMPFTQDMEVVARGMDKFRIVAPFYFTMAIFSVYSGAIRGQGFAVAPMVIGVTTMFIGRVPVAYFLSQAIGANGIHWSLSVQWALEAVVIALYYYYGGWRKKALLRA